VYFPSIERRACSSALILTIRCAWSKLNNVRFCKALNINDYSKTSIPPSAESHIYRHARESEAVLSEISINICKKDINNFFIKNLKVFSVVGLCTRVDEFCLLRYNAL
jgi:hypothetical protein